MKALLFSEWCTLKGVVRGYPLPVLIVALVATFTGLGDVEPLPDATALHIHTSVVAVGLMMLSFYGFIALFGNDEREGWEAVRLSLPVTRQTVVRTRYLALVVLFGLVAVAINLAGLALGAIVALVLYGRPGFMPPSEGILLTGVFAVVYLVYLGLTTPLVFKIGISKARIYITLPFMLCLAFTLDPVKEATQKVVEQLGMTAEALGSPLPLLAAALLVAAGIYGASLMVSERIYAARDF